jgi:small ligand-binding sensory domain FIST
VRNEHAVAAHWQGGFDEPALQQWAAKVRASLAAPTVSLGLVFLSPSLFPQSRTILEILRVHGQIPLLLGCSSASLIAESREIEDSPGLVLGLYHLPEAQLHACHFDQEEVEQAEDPDFWHDATGVKPENCNGWLVFVDPFHIDCETWLNQWNDAFPGVAIVGGLAGGLLTQQATQVFLNGEVYDTGGVAVAFSGGIGIHSVISQGCTPIGDTWTITKTEQNLIHRIANRPAYEVLADTFNHLDAEDQQKSQGNLFVGLVINEYLDEFHRGDFLIRNLLAADPRSGILAVGALPRQGQTMQFQRRDAGAATEDMRTLLQHSQEKLARTTIYGGCLCCCNGRGYRLFGQPNHDAQCVNNFLGLSGLSGFFCNGEIGPVGNRNFLHGYTASLALFVKK